MPLSRRHFCSAAAASLGARFLSAQELHPAGPTSRPDVAAIDRERILHAADRFLTRPVDPLSAHPAPHTTGAPNEFVSDLDEGSTGPGATPGAAAAFDAHRDALLQFTLAVPALAAASLLTRGSDASRSAQYAKQAAAQLRAWFSDPATRMEPSLNFAAMGPGTGGHPDGVAETSSLAEIAQAIPFLQRTESLPPEDLAAVRAWFAALLKWLTTSRLGGLARDRKDHVGSSWLLQCAAYARLLGDETQLAELRHHFKTVTLRAQILGDGSFPHELSTPNPYRNSLFNLDLLTAACDLLSTRFESLWEYQLQDGPGLHVAIARLAPFIENRGAWPYRADSRLFHDLPCRRPALLFAARAYQRPEYATLWRSLDADPVEPAILRTFPIRQPLLWVTRPMP
ncbi:MAG: hypothetical protein NVSMB3_10370 [Acidobacteriaceae bacterium]